MRLYSSDALVLRTYRYGEADCIVAFLTADRGKKRGVAKNAVKSRRRFGGALEPLTRGVVTYVEREHRELTRVDRIEARQTPLRAASGRSVDDGAQLLGQAAYFAELLDEWAPLDQANEKMFRLAAAVSEALGAGGSTEALARYFEFWLLRLEGVYPAVDVCARCGERRLSAGAVLLASERRYACLDCAHGGARLSPPAMAFLAGACGRTPHDIATTPVAPGALRELEHAHHRLIAAHLEKELRSARVVRELGSHP